MAEEGHSVELYIYDLTHGFASMLAPAIIGREVEGVWHTAIVAYGREFFYGGGGITSCAPGSTQLGAPHAVERLGETFVPFQLFRDYIQGLATTSYTGSAYSLLEHNCNHFTEEVAGFLCGAHIPKHILQQVEVLPAPHRAALQHLLDSLVPTATDPAQGARAVRHVGGAGGGGARSDSPDYVTLNDQIEEARAASAALEQRRTTLADKLARKERRKEKKRKKLHNGATNTTTHTDADIDLGQGHDMSEVAEAVPPAPVVAGASASATTSALDEEERAREDALRRATDPPIIYKDVDGLAAFDDLVKSVESTTLSEEDQQSMEELRQYLGGEGSWVLGDEFLAFVGRVLSGGVGPAAARPALLACLAACALREDVSLLLHQDRREHALLGHAADVDRLPLDEQLPLATLMCNLFESVSASEWLLYISEWELRGRTYSNIRVTTKVCVHCVLAEDLELRDRGTALLHNLATKEVKTVRFQVGKQLRDLLPRHAKSKVFDEVCVELCMATLQLLQAVPPPPEEQVWRALRALARLAHHAQEVPALIAMVGPDPEIYRGTSPRVDEQIDLLIKKVKA